MCRKFDIIFLSIWCYKHEKEVQNEQEKTRTENLLQFPCCAGADRAVIGGTVIEFFDQWDDKRPVVFHVSFVACKSIDICAVLRAHYRTCKLGASETLCSFWWWGRCLRKNTAPQTFCSLCLQQHLWQESWTIFSFHMCSFLVRAESCSHSFCFLHWQALKRAQYH